jgi:hypothetical protein
LTHPPERFFFTFQVVSSIQHDILNVAQLHIKRLVPLLDEPQQPSAAPVSSQQLLGLGLQPAAAAATMAAYVRTVEDSFRLYYGPGRSTFELYAAVHAAKILTPAIVAKFSRSMVKDALLPSLKPRHGEPKIHVVYPLLKIMPATSLLPTHEEALVDMIRLGMWEDGNELVLLVVGKLLQWVEGGGSVAFLAPVVGHLIGAMAREHGATGSTVADQAILRLLKAIPADAFGPAPVDEAETGAGGSGGGGDGGGGPAEAPSAALEDLLELMRSWQRGGLTPNEGRTRALRLLPLDRIVKPHVALVFGVFIAQLEAVCQSESAQDRALLHATRTTIAQLPLSWTLPQLLELSSLHSDDEITDDLELGEAVFSERVRVEGSEKVQRLLDAEAQRMLGILVETGEWAVRADSFNAHLLRWLWQRLSDEAVLVLKGQIKALVSDADSKKA